MDPSDVLTSAEVQAFASGFPIMVMHLVVSLLLLAAGAAVYVMLTPWREIALIREGNPAAAVASTLSLPGALPSIGAEALPAIPKKSIT